MVTQPALGQVSCSPTAVSSVTPPRNKLTLNKNRKLNKQGRRRRKRERQKAISLDGQNNNFARASRFFVHFFNVAARLQRESA